VKTEGELKDGFRLAMSVFACVVFFVGGAVAHWIYSK